jgi:hypothetical protein
MAVKKRQTFNPNQAEGGSFTRQSFAEALLLNLGITPTKPAVTKLIAWEVQEGGNWNNSAHYNPLNTTLAMPGATNTGAQGNIKSYTSPAQGIEATLRTLQASAYKGIIQALKQGSLAEFETAVNASPWGTKFPGGGAAGHGLNLGPIIKPGEHPTGVNVQGAAEEAVEGVAEAVEGVTDTAGAIEKLASDFSSQSLGELALKVVLFLAGALLVVYGIMVAVRPPDRALSLPKLPVPVPVPA